MKTSGLRKMVENSDFSDEEILTLLKTNFGHLTPTAYDEEEFRERWELGKLCWERRPDMMKKFNAWYTEEHAQLSAEVTKNDS